MASRSRAGARSTCRPARSCGSAPRPAGRARVPRDARRHRRARVSRQPRDVHPRQVRRPRGPRAARGRHAALARSAIDLPASAAGASRRAACRRTRTSGRSACSTARTARPTSSPTSDIETLFASVVEGPLQLRSHRRAPDRAEAAVGAQGRRRSRPASVEHPRQRVRDRRDRFHGRHADPPRARRPEPRRLRVPGGHRAGRAVEDRAAARRRHGSLPPDVQSRRRRRWSSELDARDRHARAATLPPRPDADTPRSRGPAQSAATRVYRASGDRYLLVEFGPNVLDLDLRFRVHALEQVLRQQRLQRDHRSHARHPLAADPLRQPACCRARSCSPCLDDVRAGAAGPRRHHASQRASCICRCRGTIRRRCSRFDKYMQSVRADAPWCPSNIEFIRRINGLDSIDDVRRHRLRRELSRARARRCLSRRAGRDAARSAAPAGDDEVQPGAHVDGGERGRHRRRLPVRVRHGRARAAISSSAARCRCGTRIARRGSSSRARRGCCASSIRSASFRCRAAELLEMRDAFPHGKYSVDIEPTEFSLRDYHAFLASIEAEAAASSARSRRRSSRSASAGPRPASRNSSSRPMTRRPPTHGRYPRRVRGRSFADDGQRVAGGRRARAARARPARRSSCSRR